MPDDVLIHAVLTRDRQLARRVRARDYVELAASVLLAAVFVFVGVQAPVTWPWIVATAIVLGVGAVFVRERRRSVETRAGGRLRDTLAAALAEVDHQIRLLRSVLWWYLAPLAVAAAFGVLGTVLGLRADADPATWQRLARGLWWLGLMTGGIVAATFAFVWWLNQNAVRRHLQPHRDALAALVDQIDRATAEEAR